MPCPPQWTLGPSAPAEPADFLPGGRPDAVREIGPDPEIDKLLEQLDDTAKRIDGKPL